MRFPFDPTLVPLPGGRLRLYFTSFNGHLVSLKAEPLAGDIQRLKVSVESDGPFNLIVQRSGQRRTFLREARWPSHLLALATEWMDSGVKGWQSPPRSQRSVRRREIMDAKSPVGLAGWENRTLAGASVENTSRPSARLLPAMLVSQPVMRRAAENRWPRPTGPKPEKGCAP